MKIKAHTLFLYIATLSFVAGSSAYIKTISQMGLIIDVIELFILSYCFFTLVKKREFNQYDWLVFLFYILLGISTFCGSKEYLSYIIYAVQGLSATIFIDYESKKDPYGLIKVFRNSLILMVFLNFIFLCIRPSGFYGNGATTYYLMGYRIAFTPFIVSAVFFSVFYDWLRGNKKISTVSTSTILIGLITLLIQNVVTGIVTLSLSFLLLVIFKKKSKLINFWTFLTAYVVVFVAIVVFDIQYHIPFLSYFLVDVLGKDLTFDNRTTIWRATITQFLKHPILGSGISGGGLIKVQFIYVTKTLSAHNQILNILYEGGILSFVAFLGMITRIAHIIGKYRNSYGVKIIACFVIGFFVIMFTEVQMTKAMIFIVFAIAANASQFISLERR